MSQHDDLPRLRDMLDHAVETVSICEGRGRQDLDSDRLLGLAVLRLLEVIGEAAARTQPQTRAMLPGNGGRPAGINALAKTKARRLAAYFRVARKNCHALRDRPDARRA